MPKREARGRKVALITGASGGLGSVVTPMFLDAGYRVSAAALDWPRARASRTKQTRRAQSSNSYVESQTDLTSWENCRRCVQDTMHRFGAIDALVHLVGAFEGGQRVEDTSEDVWDRMLGANLRTAANMMRAVIPRMRSRGSGSIVVVAATPAIHPVVTWSAFSAAVAGLCSLVQVAAAELRDAGVTVNALLPTTIDTPVVRSMMSDKQADKWVDARNLGAMMLWLCSPQGRDVTGALIPFIARQPHPCYHWHGETDEV